MIKFVFRWAFRLLLLAIVLVVAALLLKDTIARNLAEQRIRRETGFEAKIGKLEFNLFTPTLRVQNLVLYNTAEFGGSALIDLPELDLEYDKGQLPFGRIHLKLLRINARELNIVESETGRTNIIELVGRVAPEALSNGLIKKERDYSFTGVDLLNLSVGTVRYTNMRFPRRNQEIPLNMRNELVQNVRSEQDLAAILFKVLLRAGITIYMDPKPPAPVKKQ